MPGDLGTGEPPDDAAAVPAVLEAIARHVADPQGVIVLALNGDAMLQPIPAGLPCADQPPLAADSVLDLFVKEDCAEVIRAWTRTREHGAASATVRLASRPDHPITGLIGDFRRTYGVYLAVLVGDQLGPEDLKAIDSRYAVPRVCSFRVDPDLRIVEVDDAFTRMFGWAREEIVGQHGFEGVYPGDHAEMVRARLGALTSGEPRQVTIRYRRKDGTYLWTEVTYTTRRDEAGGVHCALQVVDISRQMEAITALHEREMLLSRITEMLPEGLFQVDQRGRVIYSNDRLLTLLRAEPDDRLSVLLANVAPDDRRTIEEAVAATLEDGIDRELEADVLVPDTPHRLRRCLLSVRALFDTPGAVAGAVAWVLDVTQASLQRTELERRATYDSLTRCRNRASVMGILDQALQQATRSQTAAIFVDLDGFKSVNDRLGHAAGDEVLVTMAHRLHSVLRGDDVVGRIGGDEFLVVCHDVPTDTDAELIGERVRTALAPGMTVAGQALWIGASIGIARCQGTMDADELVRRADAAMYASKGEGRGRAVLYGAVPARGSA